MLDPRAMQDLITVLLIDDDLVSREVTATMLTLSGYTVHTVQSGAAAIEFLVAGEVTPDLILMDAQMPGMSGTDLIAELRARSHARIIAISGSNPPAEVINAADAFLLKPLDVEELNKHFAGQFTQSAFPASAAIASDEPVVSLEILAQLRKLMPEPAVREIFQAIVFDLDRRTEVLEVAIAKGDVVEVRRIGHAIKGGCAMAGALQAARLGALIETFPLDYAGNQSDNSSRLLSDLRAAARALERMLEPQLPA
jgi:CheY-like chemotaxis protein